MRARLVLAVLLIAASGASAQPQGKAKPTMDDLLRLQQALRGREQQRDTMQADAEAARAQIVQLNAQLSTLSVSQATGQLSVNDKRQRLATMSLREAELAERVGANRNRLSRLLGALQLYSRNPPPALFVHPKDAKDAVRAAILIRAVTPELERRAKGYAEEVSEAKQLRRQLAAGSAEVFTAESKVADDRAKLEAMIAEKARVQAELTGGILAADREIAEIAGRAETLRKFLGALPGRSAAVPLAGKLARLNAPAPGAPIRRFGERDTAGARSEGLSWRPGAGTAVSAPTGGMVEFAGPLYGWGNVLIVQLAGGYHLVLAGMDNLAVKPGQSVAAGETVGRMANSSSLGVGSKGAELYLELRKANGPVDPAPFMQ